MPPIIPLCGVAIALLILRVYFARSCRQSKRRPTADTCSLAVFLGSGGHTREALVLISALPFHRYSPRTYIISEGDSLSAEKAMALETSKAVEQPLRAGSRAKPYRLLRVPRARHVRQSLLTTPLTALLSLLVCIYHITLTPLFSWESSCSPFAQVLILNGPGTCVVLGIAVFINRMFGLPSPKLIYVESFARVTSLSLSGKLLRPLVDRFVVQWPDLLKDRGRGECRGWLV